MRAAVYHGRQDVRIEEVAEPPEPGPGEVKLEITRCGICGTDVAEYMAGPHLIPRDAHAQTGRQVPIVIGHEFIGTVAQVGEGVTSLAVGDRVASGAGVSCGKCAWCLRGETNMCERYYTHGFQADGGLAERVTLPANTCERIPASASDDNAALAQPLAVAVHALRRTVHATGETLVLIGAGGIGSLYLAVAKSQGIPVIAADVDHAALGRALALGADLVVDLRVDDLAQVVRRETGGHGAATVVECTGRAEALDTAAQLVRRAGTLMLVGLQTAPVPFDFHRLVQREITVRTSNAHVCASDLPQALALLGARDLAPLLVDRVIPLEKLVEDGILASVRGETHGKVLVSLT
jgi:(R,R)-butanediol dehydrogenase/meso-butanediol dehydrogenase/diacetyl reductase